MTPEELKSLIKKAQEKQQDNFIDKLFKDIEWLCEKANEKDYEPTVHEKEVFTKIVTIIDNMKAWF